MSRRTKTREEIACSFYVNVSEICRLFELGRTAATRVYHKAQSIDEQELKDNCLAGTEVRLTSVLTVLGISDEEMNRKLRKD
jgi:hypothetical protein